MSRGGYMFVFRGKKGTRCLLTAPALLSAVLFDTVPPLMVRTAPSAANTKPPLPVAQLVVKLPPSTLTSPPPPTPGGHVRLSLQIVSHNMWPIGQRTHSLVLHQEGRCVRTFSTSCERDRALGSTTILTNFSILEDWLLVLVLQRKDVSL